MAHKRKNAGDAKKLHGKFPYFVFSGFQTWPMEICCKRRLRPYHKLTKARTPTTEENMEVKMPIQCTTAKPRTGPEPKASNTMPTIKLVRFESKMVAQARSKPICMACCGLSPLRNSSRIRSLISTLASMAIPKVRAMAAIPGNVKVACSMDKTANNNKILKVRPSVEKTPNRL